MNSFIEFINRVPLLIESILVVLVPSSQQVYANTYTNEELENDELIVKAVSSDEEKDFVFADSANTKYILETKGQEVATANFDKLQGELDIAIEEYEAEQAKLSRSGSSPLTPLITPPSHFTVTSMLLPLKAVFTTSPTDTDAFCLNGSFNLVIFINSGLTIALSAPSTTSKVLNFV